MIICHVQPISILTGSRKGSRGREATPLRHVLGQVLQQVRPLRPREGAQRTQGRRQ